MPEDADMDVSEDEVEHMLVTEPARSFSNGRGKVEMGLGSRSADETGKVVAMSQGTCLEGRPIPQDEQDCQIGIKNEVEVSTRGLSVAVSMCDR